MSGDLTNKRDPPGGALGEGLCSYNSACKGPGAGMSVASCWERYWSMKQEPIENELGGGGRQVPGNVHLADHRKECGFSSKCIRELLENFKLGERT